MKKVLTKKKVCCSLEKDSIFSTEVSHVVQNGLKAQKLLAQGIALGIIAISKAPCKGKSLINCPVF